MATVVSDEEMTVRSLYMRLVRSRMMGDVAYPEQHCDPVLIAEMLRDGHVEAVDDIGYRITEAGVRHYAFRVSDVLGREDMKARKTDASQPGMLKRYLLSEDFMTQLKNAHIKTLEQLNKADQRLPESSLNGWGLQQLVKWGLVEKHGSHYGITMLGKDVLVRLAESGGGTVEIEDAPSPPTPSPTRGEGALGRRVPGKRDDADRAAFHEAVRARAAEAADCEDGCDECLYKAIYDMLADRLPVLETAKEFVERERAMKRELDDILKRIQPKTG